MLQSYYAFYWTYPVPWAGFRRLSRDIEKAAEQSRTIWYSRTVVRAYVASAGGFLVPNGEIVRIERYADRGSKWLANEFREVLVRADGEGAKVAIVDFSGHKGWRSHKYLEDLYHPPADPIPVDYAQVHLGIQPFDHFKQRRSELADHRETKDKRVDEILTALKEIDGKTLKQRAAALNERGLRTLTGLEWDNENLRGFIRNYVDL